MERPWGGDGFVDFSGFSFEYCIDLLPGGVIGNTRAFGALVPGSSPGRVALKSKKVKMQSAFIKITADKN